MTGPGDSVGCLLSGDDPSVRFFTLMDLPETSPGATAPK